MADDPPATLVVTLPHITTAFLDTATSRKSAVAIITTLHRLVDGTPLPDRIAVAIVEAYYAQHGSKPWLRKAKP